MVTSEHSKMHLLLKETMHTREDRTLQYSKIKKKKRTYEVPLQADQLLNMLYLFICERACVCLLDCDSALSAGMWTHPTKH